MAVSSGRRGSLLETPGWPRYILHQVGRREADAKPQRMRPMQDTIEVTSKIEVTPLSPACGAEIGGVDLSKPLSAHEVAAIKDAWGKHLVLVFRGQKVSQDDQLRFASYFGDLGTRKKAPEPLRARTEGVQQDNEKVLLVSNIKVDGKPIGAFGEGEFWFHIDSGYTPRPYKYTFLYALELPSCGGNTMFSNMYKAYEAVPLALKEKLKGKTALHIHEYNRAKQANSSGDISGIPHHAHPIFITHPDTGRKTLFVDRLMTTRIEGIGQQESDDILDQLYEIGERREFIFEHVWQLGDFLMWDNRCTIHARTDFPKEERRLLRRCTVEGEPLFE
jgi:taurine dioxygenase